MASELADGSRFVNDTTVVDGYGGSVRVEIYHTGPVIVAEADDTDEHSAYVTDVLALIDRADLDPVRTAAREVIRQFHDFEKMRKGGTGFMGPSLRALEALL